MNSRLLFKRIVFLVLGYLASSLSVVEAQKMHMTAQRITESIKIDGQPDEKYWTNTEPSYIFTQNRPNNGAQSSFSTQVKVYYDDKAIYIIARMQDPAPNNIARELGLRDDFRKNADSFSINVDTYNNGQNALIFGVTAAGVQVDAAISNSSNYDFKWDAVWNSAVKIDEQGWTAELEIPYYALRFAKKESQTWGINFFRRIQSTNERTYWNFVDRNIQGVVNQYGTLGGLNGIEPPMRLSLMPYLSLVHSDNEKTKLKETSVNGGLDIKYGISESFTLDMTLIPDFSQVRLDDQVLNLTAFEVRFDENRPFFTEGTELFDKSGLFYSRRVGQSVGKIEKLTKYDSVIRKPDVSPLINATKVTGRTKKGLGIGFFNAVTGKTNSQIATPTDTLGEYTTNSDGKRRYKHYKTVELEYDKHIANFNVLVVDQNLKNNSNIALINTNVTRFGNGNRSNVTGTEFKFLNNTNMWRFSGFGALSTRNIYKKPTSTKSGHYKRNNGFKYFIFLGKVSGKWQYNIQRNVESDLYYINDMGFLKAPNEVSHKAEISYNIFKPTWKFNNIFLRLSADNNRLYKPSIDTERGVNMNFRVQLTNFWTVRGGHGYNLGESADYFYKSNSEPAPFPILRPHSNWLNINVSTDSRKALQVEAFKGRWVRTDWNQIDHWHGGMMRYRVSNKLSISYNLVFNREYNSIGYVFMSKTVRKNNGLDGVKLFGKRHVKRINNLVGVNYIFNNKMGINLRVRHNWSRVKYLSFYELKEDGHLHDYQYNGIKSDGTRIHDQNFNAFNLNLSYSWQIAPGSFVTAAWRQGIDVSHKDVNKGFFENFNEMFSAPQFNSFSVRITYFLDYITFKKNIQSKKNS